MYQINSCAGIAHELAHRPRIPLLTHRAR